jgi:hypothetical protein
MLLLKSDVYLDEVCLTDVRDSESAEGGARSWKLEADQSENKSYIRRSRLKEIIRMWRLGEKKSDGQDLLLERPLVARRP